MTNVLDVLSKLNQVAGAAGNIASAVQAPKPGVSSTEFWLTTLGGILVNFLPGLPVTTSAAIAGALVAVYGLGRAAVKVAHTLASARVIKKDVPDLPDLTPVTDALTKIANAAAVQGRA